jgi:hypothetical protein
MIEGQVISIDKSLDKRSFLILLRLAMFPALFIESRFNLYVPASRIL